MLEKTRKGKDAKNTAILRFYFSLRKNPAPGIALCIPFARDFFARSQARAHTQHMQNGRLLLNDLACERQLQARNQGGARQGCVRTPHCYQEPIARSVQTSLVKTPLHEHMEV